MRPLQYVVIYVAMGLLIAYNLIPYSWQQAISDFTFILGLALIGGVFGALAIYCIMAAFDDINKDGKDRGWW